jgi:hypothetical protein
MKHFVALGAERFGEERAKTQSWMPGSSPGETEGKYIITAHSTARHKAIKTNL